MSGWAGRSPSSAQVPYGKKYVTAISREKNPEIKIIFFTNISLTDLCRPWMTTILNHFVLKSGGVELKSPLRYSLNYEASNCSRSINPIAY
jgi:hypothetical protein